MNKRFIIEQYMMANRRTAKRAGIRLLQQFNSWMFDEKDFNGKWE
jgi:hypothetical protein